MIGLRREQVEGVSVARVAKDIDAANALALRDQLADQMPHEASDLIVDLSECPYLDSAGIDMLFQLHARLRQRRRTLRVVIKPESPLSRLLDIVAMPSAIPIHPTLDAALEAIRADIRREHSPAP